MKAKQGGTKKALVKKGKGNPAKSEKARKEALSKLLRAEWVLRLYVAGQTPKSVTAFSNLKKLCEEHLEDRYAIEVIDLSKQPHLAQKDQIVALPTLVRKLPEPVKRLIGDLSNFERVLAGMELKKTSDL